MPNPRVTFDLVDGLTWSFDIINGFQGSRCGIVNGLATGVDGSFDDATNLTSGILMQRAYNAIVALAPPASGCPGVTLPNYLKNIQMTECNSTDSQRFKLEYRGFPATQIEFNTSLAYVEDYVDNQGNPITVVYTYPSDYIGNPAFPGKLFTQGKAVSRPTSEPTFMVKFTTSGLPGITQLALLVGMVNNGPYPVGVIGGAARTWLCTGFRALSEDGGITYNASLSMQYRATTWDNKIMFINPDTGSPPPDLIVGTGSKTPMMAIGTSFPTLI